MVEIVRQRKFERKIKKIKDSKLKERIKKQIKKIIKNPEIEDFLRHRKCERKVYISPFRLLYAYDKKKNKLYLIDFDKRDKIYKK